ncbi:SpoIIE family protein phosphatase [Candidatus Peregrinibacteria bacterium]|nr:MAG: SpoIIE family protein phosphatase [Candidatus Peregrinibacteria bacterium]
MLRSIRAQIIAGTSFVILLTLITTAYFVVNQKVKEINLDIFENAISFADLTHERVIANYENNLLQGIDVYFKRVEAEIFNLNEDIDGMGVFNYAGEALYQSANNQVKLVDEELLERIQAILPSVKTVEGRVVYLSRSEGQTEVDFTDFNGAQADPISADEQISDVIYPFRDPNNSLRAFSVRYGVTYQALAERIRTTRNSMIILAALGILITLAVGQIIAGQITKPIKTLTQGALKIGKGDLDTHIDVNTKNEMGQLAQTFNRMAADLKNSTDQLVEKEKLTRELELAGEIQRALLPTELPVMKGLDMAASLKSAEEVGGDCYDFIPIGDDQLLFYIADVTGHGVSDGLVSAINNALVPAFMDRYNTTQELVIHLNRILKAKTRADVFMTMLMAIWSVSDSTIHFTQAGHDPMIHVSGNELKVLSSGGMALGMVPDVSKVVKTESVKIAQGDVIVLYTDGIPEAWSAPTKNYGMERFKESVLKNSHLNTAREIHDGIMKDVRDYMGSYPQADDITLIVIKKTDA